jgi:hypothetical protein
MVDALVLAVEAEIVTLDGRLPALVHRLVEDVLSTLDFDALPGPSIPPPQQHW